MVEQGYATSTIRNTRAVLKLALKLAQRDHGLSRNVAADGRGSGDIGNRRPNLGTRRC